MIVWKCAGAVWRGKFEVSVQVSVESYCLAILAVPHSLPPRPATPGK
jgi:hypothetical protein